MAEKLYQLKGKTLSNYAFNRYVTHYLSKTYDWIWDAPSMSRQNASESAYNNLRQFLKGNRWRPKKRKKKNINSVVYRSPSKKHPFGVKNGKICIPGLKYVKIKNKNYLPLEGNYLVTIKEHLGRFYACFYREEEIEKYDWENVIGLDLGISNFITLSNGKTYDKFENKKLDKQIKKCQKNLSRKIKNSKNFEKNKFRLGRLHQKRFNQSEDYLNKIIIDISKNSVKELKIEKLSIKNMIKNRKLSKAIWEVSWWRLVEKLKLKFNVIEIDRWFPSSKMCSLCGQIKEKLLLSERLYKCDFCSFECDRDLNASINIKNFAM